MEAQYRLVVSLSQKVNYIHAPLRCSLARFPDSLSVIDVVTSLDPPLSPSLTRSFGERHLLCRYLSLSLSVGGCHAITSTRSDDTNPSSQWTRGGDHGGSCPSAWTRKMSWCLHGQDEKQRCPGEAGRGITCGGGLVERTNGARAPCISIYVEVGYVVLYFQLTNYLWNDNPNYHKHNLAIGKMIVCWRGMGVLVSPT